MKQISLNYTNFFYSETCSTNDIPFLLKNPLPSHLILQKQWQFVHIKNKNTRRKMTQQNLCSVLTAWMDPGVLTLLQVLTTEPWSLLRSRRTAVILLWILRDCTEVGRLVEALAFPVCRLTSGSWAPRPAWPAPTTWGHRRTCWCSHPHSDPEEQQTREIRQEDTTTTPLIKGEASKGSPCAFGSWSWTLWPGGGPAEALEAWSQYSCPAGHREQSERK